MYGVVANISCRPDFTIVLMRMSDLREHALRGVLKSPWYLAQDGIPSFIAKARRLTEMTWA